MDFIERRKGMTFKFNEKEIFVNVEEVFEIASAEDYVDDLDAVGIVVHNLTHYSDFEKSTVFLYYNEGTEKITIEVQTKDDYEIIEEITMLPKEKDLIMEKLIA